MINRRKVLKKLVDEKVAEGIRISQFEEHNVLVGRNASISNDSEIGEYSYIGVNTKIECSIIGRYCSIGDNCTIGPGEHRIKRISTSYRIYKDSIGAEYYYGDDGKLGTIEIGNDVWVGCNVVIRRGVKIGNGAVIGAHSFVNKDVPDYAIVVGVPTQIIRYRFEKEIIDEIVRSAWWDFDIEKAKSVIEKLERKLGIII